MKNKKILPLLILLFLFIAYCLISIASPRATDYKADLQGKIDSELAKGSKVVITASKSSTSGGWGGVVTITITGKVTNVSSSTLQNLVINGMTIKDQGEVGYKYAVSDIFEEDKVEVNSLAPNASIDFTFILENINWVGNKLHGVIFVQAVNSEKKEILQALYIE